MADIELRTIREAHQELRISDRQIRRLIDKELIKAVHIGQRVFIPADEIARVKREGTAPTSGAAS
jgi:hypothetical protein